MRIERVSSSLVYLGNNLVAKSIASHAIQWHSVHMLNSTVMINSRVPVAICKLFMRWARSSLPAEGNTTTTHVQIEFADREKFYVLHLNFEERSKGVVRANGDHVTSPAASSSLREPSVHSGTGCRGNGARRTHTRLVHTFCGIVVILPAIHRGLMDFSISSHFIRPGSNRFRARSPR